MATALVLEADGRRENGRWKRGSVDIGGLANSESAWQARLKECGVVLDFKRDLAAEVVSGAGTAERPATPKDGGPVCRSS